MEPAGKSTEEKLRAIQELISSITSSDRMRTSSHFSSTVYRDEPILTTGRKMASYLPERYREMRAISRWEEGEPHGRWLSEAELFYRQGMFMADFEDDCPYTGEFKSYYPTYNALSDRQLRGYFTWRTQVRRGDIQKTSLSFVYLYIYELICGIGVANAHEGFEQLKKIWQTYREFSPELDRFMAPWLRDYVVYHGLNPALLDNDPAVVFDRALLRLVQASTPFDPAVLNSIDVIVAEEEDADSSGSQQKPEGALALPPDEAREQELLEAIDALSTYRVRLARSYKDYPDDLRHVVCAVYVRLLGYYRKHRVEGLIESMFGEQARMPYTMFGSGVFFEAVPHEDADYALDPIHWYRCRNGRWECIRTYGAREKSARLGSVLRACDRKLRDALSYPHPIKEKKLPKYLDAMIDKEIATWLAWKEKHAPRHIDIDLSQLAGIRSTAAEIREALLTDEEREGAPVKCSREESAEGFGTIIPCSNSPRQFAFGEFPAELRRDDGAEPPENDILLASTCPSAREDIVVPEGDAAEAACDLGGSRDGHVQAGVDALHTGGVDGSSLLSEGEREYLLGLLAGDAEVPSGVSEDMLVDGINEKLFDVVGDTVIEFGADGAQVIEDYEDEVREVLGI